MYIRRIIIKGFKTYRNETVIDDLSSHHNIVIGSNGSGKSNLFSAIRFVLSDDYSNLKREERRGLIHQGSTGNSIMSASVEIVFHDPEGKILLSSFGIAPKPNNEIYIRRTVGLKKDDYQINDRNVTKSEVFRILESAGFSINNPYNIVPQGKIIALTNAKDNERLKLLEDVVGAKSFEIKLNASLKKMNETDQKMKQINKEMVELKSKLKEMNTEKIELEKYNGLERTRKVLQFTLFDRELNNVITQLEKLDDDYNVTFNDSKQYMQELDKREEMITQINDSLINIENNLKIKTRTDLQQTKSLYDEISNNLVNLNIKITDLKNQLNNNDEQKNKDLRTLDIVTNEVSSREENLDKVMPRFKELTTDENNYKLKLNELQQKKRDLLLKKGNYSQFKSKEERDNWIDSEIREQTVVLENMKTSKINNEQEYNRTQETVDVLIAEIEELSDSVNGPGISAEIEDVSIEQNDLKKKYIDKIDERKELWRNEQKLATILENFSNDLKTSQRNVNETMSRTLASGIASIREITEKLKLPKTSVYGTVGELIKVSEKYKVCAEVVGGNSLFHIVVDTDETASLLMDELYRMKGGRVTFIPLNKINLDSNFSMPLTAGESAQSLQFTPLIKKIKYDTKFEKAIQHIFGRTVVVKDLANGLKLAKTYNLNAITLDGDRADKKGVLTGGYYDYHKRTRLDSMKNLTTAKKNHQQALEQIESVKQQLDAIDASVDSLNGEIRASANKKEAILTNIEKLRIKLNSKKNERAIQEETLASLVLKKEKIIMNIKLLENKITAFTNDLETDFDSELSAQEQEELKKVSLDINSISKNLTITSDTLEDITNTIDKLNAELESKLIPQKEYLELRIAEARTTVASDSQSELDSMLSEVNDLTEQKEELENDLNGVQKEIDNLNGEKLNNEKSLEKANSQQRLLLKKIENFQKSVEKNMVKKTTLLSRREELQQKIREIGLLSEDILNNFNDLSSEELLEKLTNINSDISKLTNVNKRALENYRKFNEKETELVDRSKELTVSKQSIQELVEKLKSQKISAVDSTFKKVSENFVQVFEKLVPMGTAKLIIHRTEDEDGDIDMTPTSQEPIVNTSYTGVSIAVSFNSKQNEQLYVEQLSGGQKTLCAIALILAIQMVDPAPFYLFDEIDAALDKQYRTAVAATIKNLSKNAQFICTTFRTDMLQVADKFFRVKYENKISTVVEIAKEDAIKFIRGSNKIAEI